MLDQYSSQKGVVTRDLNALKSIVLSTDTDIWVTFHASYLWWCRVADNKIYMDSISKFRNIQGKWRNDDINGNKLNINKISGRISQVQGFRATICRVKATKDLERLLNDTPSDEFNKMKESKDTLAHHVSSAIGKLHWKDFETLIDLIFRNAGWQRVSLLGETMKFIDMELKEPITGDYYQVQVKSQASENDFLRYAKEFGHEKNYRRLYFVVHTPQEDLRSYINEEYPKVEIILPEKISEMVVEFGLINWLMTKIK